MGAFHTLLWAVPTWGPQLRKIRWNWVKISTKSTNIDQKSAKISHQAYSQTSPCCGHAHAPTIPIRLTIMLSFFKKSISTSWHYFIQSKGWWHRNRNIRGKQLNIYRWAYSCWMISISAIIYNGRSSLATTQYNIGWPSQESDWEANQEIFRCTWHVWWTAYNTYLLDEIKFIHCSGNQIIISLMTISGGRSVSNKRLSTLTWISTDRFHAFFSF